MTISPERVDASEEARFRVEWRVGPSGLHAGGGFRLQFPVDPDGRPGGFTPPQTRRWYEPAHVSCRVAGAAASGAEAAAQAREGGEVRCLLARGRLEEGESLVLEYRGLAPQVAGDYALAVESRLTGGRGGRPLARRPVLRVEPRPARAIAAVAPSLVEAGAPFSLALVALDEFGNRDRDYLGEVEVEVGGRVASCRLGPLDAGVKILEGLSAREPGFAVARVIERSAPERALAARSNPIRVVARAEGERVLWGDLRFRTGSGAGGRSFAPARTPGGDGRGNLTTAGGALRYGRDVARLDFAAAAEVAGALLSPESRRAWAGQVASMDDPPRFTALAGLQWNDGLLLLPAAAALRDRALEGLGRAASETAAVPRGRLEGPWLRVLLPGSLPEEGGDAPSALEVYSGATPRDARDRRPVSPEPGPEWARSGRPPVSLVAATGGCWGRAGVRDLTGLEPDSGGLTAVSVRGDGADAILDALRRGRAWATTGPRIWARLRPDASGGSVAVEAAGTAPLVRVDLVVVTRSGVGEISLLPAPAETLETVAPLPASPAPSFCYLRVVQSDGETAWSGPVVMGRR